ncbi:MAG TPA: hypothetical protein DCY25_06510 [Bacteroidales bacterium]|nr:hypothetical protein [Bacteroidales bacterium]
MKKFILISFITVLITAAASAPSLELQEKRTGIEKKEKADHRNGAPDMRHKKPVPLQLPQQKAPDTTKQVVANPEKK